MTSGEVTIKLDDPYGDGFRVWSTAVVPQLFIGPEADDPAYMIAQYIRKHSSEIAEGLLERYRASAARSALLELIDEADPNSNSGHAEVADAILAKYTLTPKADDQ